MTADEYLNFRSWDEYELADGVLVPHGRTALAGLICAELACRLIGWCRPRKAAWVFGGRTTYCCFPGHPNTVRRPWVSLIRTGRLTREQIPAVGHIAIPPDITADVTTPSHTYEAIETKVADYRAAGVHLVWLLCPPTRTVLVRRGDGTAAELRANALLTGEDVLPGFACRVADLFL